MSGSMVELPSNGTTGTGYLAVPASGSGPGVIVLQEWWGLVDHIKEIADRFACSWPTTTRHLRQLRDAGLVAVEKVGRERIYHLDADRLSRVVGDWIEHFDDA